MFFLLILIVFILAFGVASHSLRFPNAQLSWTILKDVVYMPYWQMYGELFLEDLSGALSCSISSSFYSVL
jgi:transient receptor potential cation channel subfamily M protein 2